MGRAGAHAGALARISPWAPRQRPGARASKARSSLLLLLTIARGRPGRMKGARGRRLGRSRPHPAGAAAAQAGSPGRQVGGASFPPPPPARPRYWGGAPPRRSRGGGSSTNEQPRGLGAHRARSTTHPNRTEPSRASERPAHSRHPSIHPSIRPSVRTPSLMLLARAPAAPRSPALPADIRAHGKQAISPAPPPLPPPAAPRPPPRWCDLPRAACPDRAPVGGEMSGPGGREECSRPSTSASRPAPAGGCRRSTHASASPQVGVRCAPHGWPSPGRRRTGKEGARHERPAPAAIDGKDGAANVRREERGLPRNLVQLRAQGRPGRAPWWYLASPCVATKQHLRAGWLACLRVGLRPQASVRLRTNGSGVRGHLATGMV
eukprot:scaffold3731_cov381-Prasinococcus_capsulatus_cf.AAC.6